MVAILDSSLTPVVEYLYDAFGNILSISGNLASTLGAANPVRYRSYYYDTETGWYYLQSRYYNPEWGRFINGDDYVSTGAGVLGCNMFAYCNNNPIMYVDLNGKSIIAAIGLGLALLSTVFIVSSEDQTPNYVDEANKKYNRETVNIYSDEEGEPIEDKFNVKFYSAGEYTNISIESSLEVENSYEMDAVLDVIVDSPYYSEETFGSQDYMKAQWQAHNASYDIASSSKFGFFIISVVSGTKDPIKSSNSLDIREKENMLKRQKLIYKIISYFN